MVVACIFLFYCLIILFKELSFHYLHRIAEEVIFGEENVTTGASNDFMQVSRVARQMVERFGFSKKIGQVAIGGPGGNPFLGQQVMFFNLVITNSYICYLHDLISFTSFLFLLFT